MLNDINSTTDLLRAIALALDTNNPELLEELENVCNDWLQTSDERDAQLTLIQSAQSVLDELSSYEY